MMISRWFVRSCLFIASCGGAAFGFADNYALLYQVGGMKAWLPYPFGIVVGVASIAMIITIIVNALSDEPSNGAAV